MSKPYKCLECGKKMTFEQARKATESERGCSNCGGSDIDLAVRNTK